MAILLASQGVSHWHPSHWFVDHWHESHWYSSLEVVYDNAATICVNGTFSITASINGIWPDC